MSKKKNTLKDLDEFLKQQAAALVTPEPVESSSPKKIPHTDYSSKAASPNTVTTDKIYKELHLLSQDDPDSFRQKLYALIIQIL